MSKLAIIGGGPAGLTAAIYAGRAGLNPILVSGGFEGGSMIPGGQLMITTDVENFPGFPDGIEGPELMDRMQRQALKFGAKEIQEFAISFNLKPSGPHEITLSDGSKIIADAIILAMGAQAKWLNAKDESKYINRGISACATCDGPLEMFRDQVVCVVGGGDSAVEEANFLTRFASKVYMIVRRDTLRASEIMATRAKENPKICILWNSSIVEYMGDSNGDLSGVVLRSNDVDMALPCKGVFMAIGHSPCTNCLKDSMLEMDEVGYLKTRDLVHTNIEGVFTAGDIHDNVYRQAISAAGFGCMASIAAERWLAERH
jgi:thioredoxin reductase (NADPH)